MTNPLPCPTPKSGEIEAERSGAGWPKDFRTPQAKKWDEEFLPPETCGSIDDVQNSLEHLRDANSQLRHAAHVWKHCAEDELRRRRRLSEAVTECHLRLSEILRLCAMNGAPQERLTAIFAAAEHGRFAALSASAASPAGENGRGPDETWHERFMRLGAARDYAGALAMLRAPVGASPSGVSDGGPGIHNENKAEDLQRLRAALEHIAEACDTEISAVKLLEGCRQIASQALSSVVGEGGQGLSSSCTSLGGDGERAATPAQRKSEGGGS